MLSFGETLRRASFGKASVVVDMGKLFVTRLSKPKLLLECHLVPHLARETVPVRFLDKQRPMDVRS